ncbi:MAG: UDP-2,3-diacylglucosamine diphosphatase [Alphaproteobacteria bacterium]
MLSEPSILEPGDVTAPTALPTVTDTLIISDVHLGLPASRAASLLETLQAWRFHRLILLGDIFHDLHFGRLNAEHWEVLSHIRKLSNPKRRVEVVWVLGNHDRKAAQVASHLMGVQVCELYAWDSHGRRHLAVHGDRFDRLLTNHPVLTEVGGKLMSFAQRRLGYGRSRWMDRRHNRIVGLTGRVRKGALTFAHDRGVEVIFCGHTHDALHERLGEPDATVEYINTGCWTRRPSHYATVDASGVHLHACR